MPLPLCAPTSSDQLLELHIYMYRYIYRYTCNTPVGAQQHHTVSALDKEQVRYMFVCGRPAGGTSNRHVGEH